MKFCSTFVLVREIEIHFLNSIDLTVDRTAGETFTRHKFTDLQDN